MTEKKTLHAKLIDIQQRLKVPKDQDNKFGDFKYRNVEDIEDKLKPFLKEHSLVFYFNDEPIEVGGRVYIKATATLSDGETAFEAVAYAQEPPQPKAKTDHSQLTGATSSYARKYAASGLFLIDNTKDSDSMDHSKQPAKAQPKQDIATEAQRSLISKRLAEQFLTTNEEIKSYLQVNYGVTGILTKDDAQMVIDDLGATDDTN